MERAIERINNPIEIFQPGDIVYVGMGYGESYVSAILRKKPSKFRFESIKIGIVLGTNSSTPYKGNIPSLRNAHHEDNTYKPVTLYVVLVDNELFFNAPPWLIDVKYYSTEDA